MNSSVNSSFRIRVRTTRPTTRMANRALRFHPTPCTSLEVISNFFKFLVLTSSPISQFELIDFFLCLNAGVVPGESDLPWTGVVFGVTISSIWYWCSDQVRLNQSKRSMDQLKNQYNRRNCR